jgi:transcription-repair coupling factor (superfamily II helicase)
MPVNVDLPLAVGIPADYIADQDLRLRLYRRIADLRDETEIDALSSEFKDRFGTCLRWSRTCSIRCASNCARRGRAYRRSAMESGQVILRYPSSANGKEAERLPDLGPGIRGGKNAYWASIGKDDDWQEKLLDVLERLNKR